MGPCWLFPGFRGPAPYRKTEVRDFTGNVSEDKTVENLEWI